MDYLLALPSLLCGIALSLEDIRTRSVPRSWVLAGVSLQFVVLTMAAFVFNEARLALLPPCYGLSAALIQYALSSMAHGSLGFGDVTASAMIGQAVGVFGMEAFLLWWTIMAVIGLSSIGLRRATKVKDTAMPFVPVLFISALMAVILAHFVR